MAYKNAISFGRNPTFFDYEQNFRIILLTKKSVRDKLLAYFNMLSIENSSKTFELPFSLTDLADYLMIERTAMMRELKRLKDEKIIKKTNSQITLLTKI